MIVYEVLHQYRHFFEIRVYLRPKNKSGSEFLQKTLDLHAVVGIICRSIEFTSNILTNVIRYSIMLCEDKICLLFCFRTFK